ncbi:hypothetical protein [Klebsiella phage phiKp_21]|nr:hypothetical protein [Klebsiella phage phiKp_21]
MKEQLNEQGLRPNILHDLVYPIISIDEYEPKINQDNIVVMFQVLNNYDAAYDLSSFIEKTSKNAIDTEAAETPNLDGRYTVFVEMPRNVEFPEALYDMIVNIQNLCPDPSWKLQLYGVNDPIDLDVKEITKLINLSSPESIKEFLDVEDVKILNEGVLQISVHNKDLYYSTASAFGSEDYVKKLLSENFDIDNTPLSNYLSTDFTVVRSNDKYIVEKNGKYLILK